MRTIRAFIAINLDIDVLNVIADAIRRARQTCSDAGWTIKWLNPANQHVILRYLGEMSRVLPGLLEDELGLAFESTSPLKLEAHRLEPVTMHDGDTKRTVIAVKLEDLTGGLDGLETAIQEPLERLGFKPRPAKLEPQMIVGRIVTPGQEALESLLEPWSKENFGSCSISQVFLYQSDTAVPRGEYTRLWALPLLGPTLPDREMQRPEAPPADGVEREPQQTTDDAARDGSIEEDSEKPEESPTRDEGNDA